MSSPPSFDTIIARPVVSEKSYGGMASGRYTFRCRASATKVDIRRAVEEAFASQKVKVVSVNTVNVRGRTRRRSRRRARVVGHSASWKKAIVTLEAGQKIEGLFEGL